MPAPASATYSVTALTNCRGELRDLLDAGASNANILIRDNADVLLATIPLNDPCATIDGAGKLTFDISGPDTSADASGEAAYAEFEDSDGTVHLSLPTQEGTVAVSGYLVMNTETVTAGVEVSIVAATIG